MNINQLQQQVAAGKTGQVIKSLVDQLAIIQPADLQTPLLHLSNRWSNLAQQVELDILSTSEANIQRQKITLSLLELLKKIELPTTNQPLAIHCYTNKGKDSPRFKVGEIMQLYYEVTQACHVRVLYQLADGRTILLHDDLAIPTAQVGKPQLLNQFEVSPPLGKEQVSFSAQATPFDSLQTQTTPDGYQEVVTTPTYNVRGLKPASPKAEADLVIETYE